MPDITMCVNHSCPKATNCYRHQAEPSEWQCYAYFKADGCEHFIDMAEYGLMGEAAGDE